MKLRIWTLAVCAVLLLGCASNKDSVRPINPLDPEALERHAARLEVAQLYKTARAALNSGDYRTALELYQRLESRHPFSSYATQAQLESIYAHYRSFEPELALSAADRFVRSHPRHPQIAYVYYLKGLINFNRSNADILDVFDFDSAARDPINYKRAFEDFARMVQRFPTSPYAADARQRMIYLKNRIALHQRSIAEYYFERRAYVAASRRALDILSKFQGTDSVPPMLNLLARCYDKLELPEQASSIRAVLSASYPDFAAEDKPAERPQSSPLEAPPQADV